MGWDELGWNQDHTRDAGFVLKSRNFFPPLIGKLIGYDHRASRERISDSQLHVVTIDRLMTALVDRHVARMKHRFLYWQRFGSVVRAVGRAGFGLCLHSSAESSYVYVARRQLHFSS